MPYFVGRAHREERETNEMKIEEAKNIEKKRKSTEKSFAIRGPRINLYTFGEALVKE